MQQKSLSVVVHVDIAYPLPTCHRQWWQFSVSITFSTDANPHLTESRNKPWWGRAQPGRRGPHMTLRYNVYRHPTPPAPHKNIKTRRIQTRGEGTGSPAVWPVTPVPRSGCGASDVKHQQRKTKHKKTKQNCAVCVQKESPRSVPSLPFGGQHPQEHKEEKKLLKLHANRERATRNNPPPRQHDHTKGGGRQPHPRKKRAT